MQCGHVCEGASNIFIIFDGVNISVSEIVTEQNHQQQGQKISCIEMFIAILFIIRNYCISTDRKE